MQITGRVSIGLTPATISALAMPFFDAMKSRYPEVEVHIVESFSGSPTAHREAETAKAHRG